MPQTSERIANLQQQIHTRRQELHDKQVHFQALVQHGQKYSQQLDKYYASLFKANKQEMQQHFNKYPPQIVAGWNSEQWRSWGTNDTGEERTIRIGDMVEQQANGLCLPGYAPFIGQGKTIIIRSTETAQGLSLLQSLVVRTAALLPHRSRYTLLDPAGNGQAFLMRRYLPQVRQSSSDVRQDLAHVITDIQRIKETYLDTAIHSFELVPQEMRLNERFQFVFAANFPEGYDRRSIEMLQIIGNTGTAAGVYLFIQQDLNYELYRDVSMNGFKNAFYIDMPNSITVAGRTLHFQADGTPPVDVQGRLFKAIAEAKAPGTILPWNDIVGIPEARWWQTEATQILETPIGRRSSGENLNLWFGVRGEQPCAHGILGAMTGSGKSNLYHVLIGGLAVRYSPKEIQLYLVDGKDGVEFQPYRHLPHVKVVSLRSSAELSRSVLSELVAEKERRNGIFKKAEVVDFISYRGKGQPLGNLPRILLLIDEYQELFEGDREGTGSAYLYQLASQGRSTGIHMLLASQLFGVPGMLNQAAILGNMHMRMAMQMTDSDIQALTEFGRQGKHLIATCDLPGKIVVNDMNGSDTANKVGKVAYLAKENRDQILQRLAAKTDTFPKKLLPRTIVFDGQAQPQIRDNPQFSHLADAPTWLTLQDMQRFARTPEQQGGLGVAHWVEAEHPSVLWLGQEFNVHGQAKIILRRGIHENVMVLGGISAARYGMLAAILTSLSLNIGPAGIQYYILDRCIPGTQWSNVLETVNKVVIQQVKYTSFYSRDSNALPNMLDDLLTEMSLRHEIDETLLLTKPSIFVMLTELERVDTLRRKADTYSFKDSPLGEKLIRLLGEGPEVGIHFILSFSSLTAMSHVLDTKRLMLFQHAVALQMSEDDSFTFVKNRKAAQLQTEGETPICALYYDKGNNITTRFKPYSIDQEALSSDDSLMEQIHKVGIILTKRRKNL